ncbi:protein S100-A5 [Osmerus eperlanus]|uniref:protein S100-A5 n=1 Tax=Osmerus eperlanus TaxID=29151 RepID=UPI002E0D6E5E
MAAENKPTEMESAIRTVVGTFAKSTGGKATLGGKAFDGLVKKQLGQILAGTNSSSALKEMRMGLDENSDGKVSFKEYLTLIGYLAQTLSQQRMGDNANVAS